MALPTKHIIHQGPVLASLGGTVLSALRQKLSGETPSTPVTPGPEITTTIPPRPASLVRDYVRHVGGDPSSYRKTIPAHLFPQWGFPLAAQTLAGLPYPLARVLNGGCRMELNAPLPAGVPLRVRARLEDIDDNGRRAVLKQRVITGTDECPDALVSYLYAIVPLGGGKGAKKSETKSAPKVKKEPKRVPAGARELAYWRIPGDAGLAFAMLTGDFNPVHWIRPYARMFGFRSTILHGFSTMARAVEGLQRTAFAGSTRELATFDVQFTKPLILPAKIGLYQDGDTVYVGDAPGASAYLVGTFTRAS